MSVLFENSRAAMCVFVQMVPPRLKPSGVSLPKPRSRLGVSKAAADKATADLSAEQAARRHFEERVTEVEQRLKDTTRKCESL